VTTPPGVALRRAVPEDAAALATVFDAAVRAGWTYLGELVEEPIFPDEDWQRLVADHAPPNVLLVAVDEAMGVVGYTAVRPDDREMFLLFVHPAHAGRGIGRILLGAGHDALRAAGVRQVHLFVHEQNQRALTVYGAAGYVPDGSERISEFRGSRVRELRLVKDLRKDRSGEETAEHPRV
jgi:RimJ/RimL family protein N-acetyltransferase